MPFSRKNRIALAVLCALPLLASADDGLTLKPQSRLLPLPDPAEEVPLFIDANRIQGTQDKELEAFGDVRMRKRGQSFAADWMRHDTPTDVLDAKGNVRLEQGREVIEARKHLFASTHRAVLSWKSPISDCHQIFVA